MSEKETPVAEQEKPASSKKIHAVYIFIILLLLAAGGYQAFMFNTVTEQLVHTQVVLSETSTAKDSLLWQLDSIYMEYESLKTDNDSINTVITAQQEEIRAVYNRLRRAENANRAEIESYKKELANMKATLVQKFAEVDSLGALTKFLQFENEKLIAEAEQAQKIDEEKTQQLESLAVKMELASVHKALNLISVPLNSKSKPNFRIKKVTRIKTSCTLAENAVIEAGNIDIYLRITRRDGAVLTRSQDNIFEYDGEKILYSEKREVNYQNRDTKIDIFYDPTAEELMPGTYKVVLFAHGKEIGSTNFVLN
jgi:hypothetical protein